MVFEFGTKSAEGISAFPGHDVERTIVIRYAWFLCRVAHFPGGLLENMNASAAPLFSAHDIP